MIIKKIKQILEGEKDFRLKQAIQLLYVDLIDDWSQASVFPLKLREKLNKEMPLGIKSELFLSSDHQSGKVIITLADGLRTESSLMVHADGRNTVCLSSQVGCPLACSFCATGQMGFQRNLDYGEILLQIIFWARRLKREDKRVSNVVFMGMGEPFLNYDNVFKTIKFINDPNLFNISARKISISTIGVVDKIKKMTTEIIRPELAISLHAPNDNLRSRLMPYAKNYTIKTLLMMSDFYIKKTNRKVMLEYLMIKGVNDGEREARELSSLLSGKKLYLVNLIKYNDTGNFKASSQEVIDNFKNILIKSGIKVVERHRFNQDIFGACGQLALKIKKHN